MRTLILAVFLFAVLIFPHELGHFIAAKACDVQVNEFSFGMGPLIWKKKRGETQYSIRALPIGGYCAMEGEDEESDNQRAFTNKKGWQKIVILFAGAFMNILICVFVMFLVALVVGMPSTTIGQVYEGQPAYQAGLRSGDKILEVNGTRIREWNDVASAIGTEGKTVRVRAVRGSSERVFNIQPRYNKQEKRYMIGIYPGVSHSPGMAAVSGVRATWGFTVSMYQGLKMLVTGAAKASDMAGPVGMVTMVHQTASHLSSFFILLAFMSMNLAVVNLLPLPALDGGRILFVIIRALTGGRITDRTEGYVHFVGITLLMALMLFVTWNDIIRLLH